MRNFKLMKLVLAATLIVPIIGAPATVAANATVKENNMEVAVVSGFTDVKVGHWAYLPIMEMKQVGVVNGYPDGTYQPYKSISRAHSAVLLARALELKPVRAGKDFKDVPKTHPYYKEIQAVYRAGIFDGDNGYFKPHNELSRAHMSKVLVNALDLKEKLDAAKKQSLKKVSFTDVSDDHWAKESIHIIYVYGITTGDKGKFKPQVPVSRSQYAAFLYRAWKNNLLTLPLKVM